MRIPSGTKLVAVLAVVPLLACEWIFPMRVQAGDCTAPAAPSCSATESTLTPSRSPVHRGNPGTFVLSAGTWHGQSITSMKSDDQFIGDCHGGTVLTGDDTTVTLFSQPAGETGVVFANITVEHYNKSVKNCYLGAIHGASWTFVNDIFQFNNCAAIVLGTGGGHVIGGRYSDNMETGIGASSSDDVTVESAEIARNNVRGDDPGTGVAGLFGSSSNNLHAFNNYIHDNGSPGLWCDSGGGWLIEGNTIVGNRDIGIRYQDSAGGTVRNNVVNDNTQGIYIEDSGTTEVYGNNVRVLASGGDGIIILNDEAMSDPSNDTLHDNVITFLGSMGQFGFADGTQVPYVGTSSDRNTFCVPDPTNSYWIWSLSSNGWNVMTTTWSSYRSGSGMDANSTLRTGDCSVAGRSNGCPALP